MILIFIGAGVILLVAIMLPFFTGRGGMLAASGSINSSEKLNSLKQSILQQYIQEEASHKTGDLPAFAWKKRQNFLINRYIDCARRLDFISSVDQPADKGAS